MSPVKSHDHNHLLEFFRFIQVSYPEKHVTRKRIQAASEANGIKTISLSDFVAKRRQARISSGVSPSYSSNISAESAPWASKPRIYSTVNRVPLITGFPSMTFGSRTIRKRSSCSFMPTPTSELSNNLQFKRKALLSIKDSRGTVSGKFTSCPRGILHTILAHNSGTQFWLNQAGAKRTWNSIQQL